MKRLIVAMLVAGMAMGVQANMVNRGVRELRVQGMIDSSVDLNLQLEVGYGYFIRDFLELGGVVGIDYRDGGDDVLARVGSFLERSVPTDSDHWMPYFGGGAGLVLSDTSQGSDAGVELIGYGGVKYYVEDNLAIGIEGRVTLATEDLYLADDGEYESFDWAILISTRFFY